MSTDGMVMLTATTLNGLMALLLWLSLPAGFACLSSGVQCRSFA